MYQKSLRWGGLLIIVAAVLVNSMNILVYSGQHNALIQAIYGIGFTGLGLAATFIHVAQGQRAGIFGLLAYLLTILSLLYANVITFLILAELAGIEGAQETLVALWTPFMQVAVYGVHVGWLLLGASAAQAVVLPRWAGVLVALGAALQIPAQTATEPAGPLFFWFTVGGSILFGAGLSWIGLSIGPGNRWDEKEQEVAALDRKWGGPLLIFSGLMAALDAMLNMLGGLSLASGITHVISYTAFALIGFLLYTAHGRRGSWLSFAGFLFMQLGAALYTITAFLIVAQLAGWIDNNIALMASWVDIPVGRYGGHMVTIGIFLFGIEAIRSGVFPGASGWLVLIGIALALPFTFTVQAYFLGIFWVIGATIEGIGIAWMGLTLMREKARQQIVQFAESTH